MARARKALSTRKVGHAGTLDPDATGVLVVACGRVTRLMRYIGAGAKTYRAQVVLGSSTSTQDSSGEVTGRWDMTGVTSEQAAAVAAELTGDIRQIPPMVSALKVGGRRLHQLAREGVEIEREARPVTVHRFEVTDGPEPGVLAIEVECSAGTYVRTLAHDLGARLGGGAHLRGLRRTRVGEFSLDESVSLERLEEEGSACLQPLEEALRGLPVITVDTAQARMVGHGRALRVELVPGVDGPGPWQVRGPDGRALAVYVYGHEGEIKPEVVVG